jgi:hypothetical protein
VVITDVIITDVIITDFVIVDVVITNPVITDVIITDVVIFDVVITDPVITDVVITDQVITDPVISVGAAALPHRTACDLIVWMGYDELGAPIVQLPIGPGRPWRANTIVPHQAAQTREIRFTSWASTRHGPHPPGCRTQSNRSKPRLFNPAPRD